MKIQHLSIFLLLSGRDSLRKRQFEASLFRQLVEEFCRDFLSWNVPKSFFAQELAPNGFPNWTFGSHISQRAAFSKSPHAVQQVVELVHFVRLDALESYRGVAAAVQTLNSESTNFNIMLYSSGMLFVFYFFAF